MSRDRRQLSLLVPQKKRRERDAYFTPIEAVYALAALQPMSGTLLDPSCGDGRMAAALALRNRFDAVRLNDLLPLLSADTDRTLGEAAGRVELTKTCAINGVGVWSTVDWIVTNPPWILASEFASRADHFARRGVALLLRLTFLEATRKRLWLRTSPPRAVIVLPRISFTGDGGHDSACPAWFLWGEDVRPSGVVVLGPDDLRAFSALSLGLRKDHDASLSSLSLAASAV